MNTLPPATRPGLVVGDEVCLVEARTGRQVDLSRVDEVHPNGDVSVRGWRARFSPQGIEVRPERGSRQPSGSVCEVRGLDGKLIAILPRRRARISRGRSARWIIRLADEADRAAVKEHDRVCELAGFLSRRLARAARGGVPLTPEVLAEAARILGIVPR